MNVAQTGRTLRVRTDKDTQFTAALTQDHAIQVTIAPETGQAGANPAPGGYSLPLGPRMRATLRGLRILSKENLAWEVWFFGSSAFATTNADTELFLGRWTFGASDGVVATVGSTTDTYYAYYVDGLGINLIDAAKVGNIYMRLVNRSVAAKTAGAAGEIVIELVVEPAQAI